MSDSPAAIRPDPQIIRRRWRIIFLIYALALTTGTHWPKLAVQTPVPSSDKLAHFLAFGLLTWLLWRTRWVSSLLLLLVVCVIWTGLDEAAQAIPGVNRHTSREDFLAGAVGVVTATSLILGFAPVGGVAEQMRRRCERLVVRRAWRQPRMRRRMLLRWSLWMLLTLTLAAIHWVVILRAADGLSSNLASGQSGPMPQNMTSMLAELHAGALMRAAIMSALLLVAGFSSGVRSARRWAVIHSRDDLISDHPCFACGASCRDLAFDDRGWSTCPRCRVPVHAGQWIVPPTIVDRRRRSRATRMSGRMYVFGALVSTAIIVAMVAIIVFGYDRVEAFTVIMCLVAPPTIAWFARQTRRPLADIYDRQHLTCRECEYDLHATPVERGVGTCSECGVKFARVDAASSPSTSTDR